MSNENGTAARSKWSGARTLRDDELNGLGGVVDLRTSGGADEDRAFLLYLLRSAVTTIRDRDHTIDVVREAHVTTIKEKLAEQDRIRVLHDRIRGLQGELARLERERRDLRTRLQTMHRRAQRAESKASEGTPFFLAEHQARSYLASHQARSNAEALGGLNLLDSISSMGGGGGFQRPAASEESAAPKPDKPAGQKTPAEKTPAGGGTSIFSGPAGSAGLHVPAFASILPF